MPSSPEGGVAGELQIPPAKRPVLDLLDIGAERAHVRHVVVQAPARVREPDDAARVSVDVTATFANWRTATTASPFTAMAC